MLLKVEFDRFCEEARRRLKSDRAYLTKKGSCSLVTASSDDASLIVACYSQLSLEEVRERLSAEGFEVINGEWASELQLEDAQVANGFIAAVSYRSSNSKPGIWVDAYPKEPLPAEIIKNLYEEFRETGELSDVSFEDFLRLANPNVLVIGPDTIRTFLEEKNR